MSNTQHDQGGSEMTNEAEAAGKGKLVELLGALAIKEGFSPSNLAGVQFIRSNKPFPRMPVVYEPSIVIVGQGKKIGYLGGQVYIYDPYNYLVLSVPLPFECETLATPEEPYLAVSVRVDPVMVGELLIEMDDDIPDKGTAERGIISTPMTDDMISATVRLLECLKSPLDSRILGPHNVREIIYRVLYGEQGGALRALAVRHTRFSQIARVLRRIHTEYDKELDMEFLAGEANMSISTFHHNFKAVTSSSPLQYLKSIRLHKALMLMIRDGLNASAAAGKVGYESASQFSREFKRYFGNSPADEAAKLRSMSV
jgi:AraC-like DNA-binding protein